MTKNAPTGDRFLDERAKKKSAPEDPRPPLPEERLTQDAAVAARALLADSEARTEDPAARDLDDGRVERRTTPETVPPAPQP